MRKTLAFVLAVVLLVYGFTFAVVAQEMSAEEIMKKATSHEDPEDVKAVITMELTARTGSQRHMTVKTLRKGTEKMIMWFLEPGDVKGSSFLRVEEGDDLNMWLYLPAFRRVRRISGPARSGSFMGTDFSYNDMGMMKYEDYKYEMVGEEEIDGTPVYVIDCIPLPGTESDYVKIRAYVRKADFWTIREELFDGDGVKKVKTIGDFTNIGGYTLMTRMEMYDTRKDHRTVLIFDNIQVDQGVGDDAFTTRSLERIQN